MGSASWDASVYKSYTESAFRSASVLENFQSRSKDHRFDPKKIAIRESRDSDVNPCSTAIILGLDVTGSMGMIAQNIAQKGLGTFVEGILDRNIVSNPHVMIMAIGDVIFDEAPLQVTQFEADIRIAEQLKDLFIEGHGGGNDSESYHLPWYFASLKTSTDCFEKRGKKGYLFTIGDELVPPTLTKTHIGSVLDSSGEKDYTADELFAMASETYEVFHVIVEQGNYAKRCLPQVKANWRELMGHRAILLNDYTHVADVLLATIEVSEGADPQTVIDSFQDKTLKETIRHALLD